MEEAHFNLRGFTQTLIFTHLIAVFIVTTVVPGDSERVLAADTEARKHTVYTSASQYLADQPEFILAQMTKDGKPTIYQQSDTKTKKPLSLVDYTDLDLESQSNNSLQLFEAMGEEIVEEGDLVPFSNTQDTPVLEDTLDKVTLDEENTIAATPSDVMLLAGLIQTEATSCSHEEKVAVGLTVLYRTVSGKWSSTIAGNIFRPGQYAVPSDEPSEAAIVAAEDAIRLSNSLDNGEAPTEWVLPREYVYFFGDGKHNYFYSYAGGLHFYDGLPNAPLPSNVYQLYEDIVEEKASYGTETDVNAGTEVETEVTSDEEVEVEAISEEVENEMTSDEVEAEVDDLVPNLGTEQTIQQ